MEDFRVINCGMLDVENVRIEIFFGDCDECVASGQYNVRGNWAHVTRTEEYEDALSSDWEDEMQEAIENRDIEIA